MQSCSFNEKSFPPGRFYSPIVESFSFIFYVFFQDGKSYELLFPLQMQEASGCSMTDL